LSDRKVDVAHSHETRWKGSDHTIDEAESKRYKLFWMGGKERSDGVGILWQRNGWTVLLVPKGK